jgi:hypothetical protein
MNDPLGKGESAMKKLNEDELRFVRNLLTWDQMRRTADGIYCYFFLLCGGIILAAVAFLSVRYLNDRTALWFTVPGFSLGLILIGAYIMAERRLKERRIIASVLKKLFNEG